MIWTISSENLLDLFSIYILEKKDIENQSTIDNNKKL
jgi:hypothetical protein